MECYPVLAKPLAKVLEVLRHRICLVEHLGQQRIKRDRVRGICLISRKIEMEVVKM